MTKWIICFLIILLPTTAMANEWTKEDTQRQLAYTTLHLLDWGQTRDIIQRDDYYETNFLLGKNPSKNDVDRYFIGTLLGHWVIAKMLKPKHRRLWQTLTTVLEAGVVGNNYRMGINLRF